MLLIRLDIHISLIYSLICKNVLFYNDWNCIIVINYQ
jgi:hypothetical protein